MTRSVLLATTMLSGLATMPVHAQATLATPAATAQADPVVPAPTAGPAGVAAPPQADSAKASSALGDIVVTAQRRSQRVQDVGIAISAYSGETLKAQAINTSAELARITPGVYQSGSVGGQSTQFSIRGVTQSDFNDAVEAPVAVYIDEGYVPSQQGQTLALFDIDRVEVLKGPQGTLFGRNATGGLVQFIINKPTDVTTGYLTTSYGRFDDVKIEAALGGPLAPNVTARASFYYHSNGDIWKNVYPAGLPNGASRPPFIGSQLTPCCNDLGDQRTIAGRLQLQFQPTDRLTIRLTGSASDQDLSTPGYTSVATIGHFDSAGRLVDVTRAGPNETRVAIAADGSNFSGLPFADPSGQRPVPGGDLFGFVAPDIGKRELSNDLAKSNANHTNNYTAALHINEDLGWANLVSITDFKRNTKNFIIDLDGTATNIAAYATRAKNDGLSQEIRLSGKSSSLEWVAGLYYLHVNAASVNGLPAPRGSYLAAAYGMADTGVDPVSDFSLHTRSYSAFGQIEYKFAPKWTFVLGGRLIREVQRYNYESYAAANTDDYTIDNATRLFQIFPSFSDHRAKTLWAGKAQIEFRPTRGLLTYFGVNRGVKAGSYNAKLPDGTAALPPENIPYKPEVLTSYEGGFKYTLPGGWLLIDASAFYYDYKDYQAFTFVDVSGFVQNRNARTYGGEFSITARPVDGLTATFAGSILHARVKDLEIAPGVSATVKPAYTPEKQFSGRIAYQFQRPILKGDVTVAFDGNYTGSVYHNIRNFSGDRFPGYYLFDGSIGWKSETTGWSLSAYVKNITDKRYQVIGFDFATFCGCNIEAYGTPRTWGISASYKF